MIESPPARAGAAPAAETRVQAARRAAASGWIWIPYIWLFLVSTRNLSRWFAPQGGTAVDQDLSGSPLDRAVLTFLMVIALYVLGSRGRRTKEILGRNKWLIVLFVYMILSIMWSNFPAISFRRCFRSIGTFLMVLVVLTEPDPLEGIRALLRRLYLVHIPLSVAAIKYFRNIGVVYTWDGTSEMWVGLAVHKNNLGQVAMCSGLVFTWQILRNWASRKILLDLLLLTLTLWVLRGSETSHSTTAMIGFIVSAATMIGLQLVKKRAAQARRIVLRAAVVLIALSPVAYLAFQAADLMPAQAVVGAAGRDMTFSDRTYIWKDLLDNAARNPVLGVGFGAFWVGPAGYAVYPLRNWARVTHTWRPGEGHNGYIDVAVDLGAIGLALVVIIICLAIGGALADLQNRFELGRLRLTLLLSILINNLAESSFLNGTHSLWFIFLLVAVNIPRATPKGAKYSVLRPLPRGRGSVSA